MTTRNERDRREGRKTNAADWAKQSMGGFEATSVKAPDGVQFFTLKPGVVEIDVVNYITGKGNPAADEDYEHFERTYYAHRRMGLEGKATYCCGKTFREPCPICAWIAKHGNSNPETAADIKQQVRQLWCVIDLANKDKGVMIFDAAYFKSFGEMLKNKLKARPKYSTFADLEGGYTLILTVDETPIGKGGKFNAVTNIEMEPREMIYPDKLLDEAPCLDDCLIKKTKEELTAVLNETLYGDVAGSDGPKEQPKAAIPEDKPRTTSRRSDNEGISDLPVRGPGIQTGNGRNRMVAEPEEQPIRRSEARGDEGRTDSRGTVSGKPQQYEIGEFVLWDGIQWEVRRVNRTGTLDLEDDNGQTEANIDPKDVHRIRVRGKSEEGTVPTPTVRPSAKPKEEEPEDDAPPPRRGRPARN